MATRRENGMGSMLRRTQRSENASPYKRRVAARRSPPPAKIPSSSSLSSFLSLLSAPFRRKPSLPALPVAAASESEASDDDASEDASDDEEQGSPEPAPELGFGPPPKAAARQTVNTRDASAAATLSQMGRSLQQSIPQLKVPPTSTFFPSSADHPPAPASSGIMPSASTSHIAPLNRPRRGVQPAFATVSRAAGKRAARPSFPGGIGSYGGFGSTAEPSSPPFANAAPLESSFAANRSANINSNPFSFTSNKPAAPTTNNDHRPNGPKVATLPAPRALHGKTSSEVLAEFFASKGKAPLTPEERKRVARLIADSEAESAEPPESDPYNGVPSFSFLKSSFPAPKSESISPSNSFLGNDTGPVANSTTFSFNLSTSSAGNTTQSSRSAPTLSGVAIAPRRRRPINYGGSNKRSAAITRAGFTVREHQKLLEKQKAQQAAENVAPDPSVVGDKRSVQDTEEDGGGKRRKTNDGQAGEQSKDKEAPSVARVMNLSAQPNMPSPLRQMTKLDSPSPPRVVRRAQAPSPSSPLAQPADAAAKPRPKPRTSIVADVMRDMLAEDKQREKVQEKEKNMDKGRDEVFANPYDDLVPVPAVVAPKVRKPRRQSARPAARSGTTKRAEPESKPLSLIEKIEKTDARSNVKKARTDSEPPAPPLVTTSIQPPTLTFTAPSPKDTKPKARRPGPIIEEPAETGETTEIEVIDLDDDEEPDTPKSKQPRPALTIEMNKSTERGGAGPPLLGVPRQRPSFSLHSPARPSPLREMSVPIEDEIEEEPAPVPAPAPAASGFGATANGFGSATSGFGPTTNGFGSNTNGFGSSTGFGGFGSTTNGAGAGSGTHHSFGFAAPPASSGTFSAPLPPPAPTLAPARLPTPVKDVLKSESPLFTAKPEPPKAAPAEATIPAAVVAPKVEAPKVEEKPKAEAPAAIPVPTPMTEVETKLSVKNIPVSALPTFAFTPSSLIPVTKVPESTEARAATAIPVSKLPTFSFGSASAPAPASAPTPSFNWAAAGMNAPPAPASDQWKCGTCDCTSPASATKCTVCEAPKPTAAGSAPARATSFDWAAAGIKPPSTGGADGQWECGTCNCMSPAGAAKCTVCEAPKPSSSASVAPTPAPAPAPARTTSFDWAAAGMKVPVATGAWTCGICGLPNKNASATKCEVCESPR
ncbi:hypothetical protein FRC10_009845 [Ceratobasidium sp. 414]|nr:hypothetical protein FRC10_009845 [Ceratobasidium sp. 414]